MSICFLFLLFWLTLSLAHRPKENVTTDEKLIKYRDTSFLSNPKCRNAFDLEKYKFHKDVLSFNSPPRLFTRREIDRFAGRSTVKVINAGAGTTGLSALYETVCVHMNLSSWYGPWQCGNETPGKVSTDYSKALQLLNSTEVSVLKALRKRALELTQTTLYVSDTPVAEILLDLLYLAPKASLLLSVVTPEEWVKKRLKHRALMCQPKFWNKPSVLRPSVVNTNGGNSGGNTGLFAPILHPFDHIGCLRLGRTPGNSFIDIYTYVYGSAMRSSRHDSAAAIAECSMMSMENNGNTTTGSNQPISTTKICPKDVRDRFRHVMEAYVEMNSINWQLAEAFGRVVLPVCLWEATNHTQAGVNAYIISVINVLLN